LAPMVVEEVFAILRTLNRDEGVSMLLVEQNAILAQAYLLETGQLVLHGPSRDMREDDGIRRSYLGY
jgi:branched-chain amino acid transport system ATP-binding protein